MGQTFTAEGDITTIAADAADKDNAADQLAPPGDAEPEVIEHPGRDFREGEPRSEGAVQVVAPDPADQAVKEAVAGTAIVATGRLDVSTLGEDWQHDWLEFKGDKLGIRLPTRQALAAFSLASSKYVEIGVKNDLTGLFIARHLSPESYGRVFSRLMDPDEKDYSVETVGELFNAIVTASINADKAEAAAKVPDKSE
jgi:hypothetical protein